jgi:hypothetical protein
LGNNNRHDTWKSTCVSAYGSGWLGNPQPDIVHTATWRNLHYDIINQADWHLCNHVGNPWLWHQWCHSQRSRSNPGEHTKNVALCAHNLLQ